MPYQPAAPITNSAPANPKVAQRGFTVSIAIPAGSKTQGEIISKYFACRIPIKAIATINNAPYNSNRSAGRASHHPTRIRQDKIATATGMLSHQNQGATDSLTKSE